MSNNMRETRGGRMSFTSYAEHMAFLDGLMADGYKKRRFLQPIQVADVNGEVHDLGHTTTNLSTSQMMDYIAQVQQFAVEFLNVIIPDPGEQAELWTE